MYKVYLLQTREGTIFLVRNILKEQGSYQSIVIRALEQ